MSDRTEGKTVGTAEDAAAETRCGFVALIGAPNAGKSTLTNTLVGAKVSIVTHKVQTTRTRIRGIAIHDRTQIILVDTPGIFRPRRRLDKAMVSAAWGGLKDADLGVLLVDARKGKDPDVARILTGLKTATQPVALALNKVDLVPKANLLALAQELSEAHDFARVFMISALTGDGVPDLLTWLAQSLPPGPWLYPEDQIADAPLRFLAAEINREKLYLRLHQELPYDSTVETTSWQEKENGIRIEQTIFVSRESQKKIVLGKGGRTIKAISMAARKELSEIFGKPVHLFLFVAVREKWGDDPERYAQMGLEFPRK